MLKLLVVEPGIRCMAPATLMMSGPVRYGRLSRSPVLYLANVTTSQRVEMVSQAYVCILGLKLIFS